MKGSHDPWDPTPDPDGKVAGAEPLGFRDLESWNAERLKRRDAQVKETERRKQNFRIVEEMDYSEIAGRLRSYFLVERRVRYLLFFTRWTYLKMFPTEDAARQYVMWLIQNPTQKRILLP